MSKTHIVWFNQDLRVHDHAPLVAACASGDPVLALYIFQPELWSGPDGTARQLSFLKESLADLASALEERGAQLVIRMGEPANIFAQLHRDHGIAAIHLHRGGRSGQEGLGVDAVRRWALRAGVSMREQDTNGIVKPSAPVNEWRARWHDYMSAPRKRAPEFIYAASARTENIEDIQLSYLQESGDAPAPPGGRTHAVRLLRRAFIAGDPHTYRDVVRALKQHIMFGTISIREAVQAAWRAQRIGAPGENITYAETLVARLRDDCERQYRVQQRRSARPFGGAGHSFAEPGSAGARASSSIKAANDRSRILHGPQTQSDQLSFDFQEPRQAS